MHAKSFNEHVFCTAACVLLVCVGSTAAGTHRVDYPHSGTDEVATLEPHTISAATDSNFCDLCVNRLPEGVSGCRAEFYTSERLKKCGVPLGMASYFFIVSVYV